MPLTTKYDLNLPTAVPESQASYYPKFSSHSSRTENRTAPALAWPSAKRSSTRITEQFQSQVANKGPPSKSICRSRRPLKVEHESFQPNDPLLGSARLHSLAGKGYCSLRRKHFMRRSPL